MRSKRLLTILLAVCLLLSCVAPGATAVTNDNKASVVTDKKANNDKSSALQNNLIVTDKDSNKV